MAPWSTITTTSPPSIALTNLMVFQIIKPITELGLSLKVGSNAIGGSGLFKQLRAPTNLPNHFIIITVSSTISSRLVLWWLRFHFSSQRKHNPNSLICWSSPLLGRRILPKVRWFGVVVFRFLVVVLFGSATTGGFRLV